MVDSSSNIRKRIITESDIATLLQRYDMKTILRMLQEMAYYSEFKMDWNEMVKNTTTTGITNAREYQLLWRHLSYREPLLPVEDDAQPLDDDSDMECELEASPAVSHEASVEAIAHVKVMAASYVPNESDILDDSTVEAPLTINIPYVLPEGTQEPSESPWSSRGMNITFPVCLQKATPTEGMNGNGSASSSMAFRRKRKKWSAEEDEELFAAVKRCGEGNWAHIVKGDFRGERTASQLSQRWALIRKRGDSSTSVSQSDLQGTEAQIAVNHALSLALGNRPPTKKTFSISTTTSSCGIAETQANGASSSQGQQLSKPVVQALPRAAKSVKASKSRVVRKTTASSISRSDLMVTANSVAVAACLGGVSTAASVPKVEPGKTNALFVPKTEPVENASTACMLRPSGSLSVPKVEPGTSVTASSIIKAVGPANTLPLANGKLKPVTASSSSNKCSLLHPRSEGSTMLLASAPLASESRIVSNQRFFAASVPSTVLQPKPTAETVTCKPDGGQKELARGNGASSSAAIQANQMTSTNSQISRGKQATQAQSPNLLPRKIPVFQTAVHGATNQELVDKPSDKTVIPSISGAGSQSKAKCEINNKVGPAIKVSSVCGKPSEVATVAGTGQGV